MSASYFLLDGLRPGAPGLAGRVHAAGATLSVDPNWDPSGGWDGGLPALLPTVDVFLPNAAEAQMLTGRSDPLEAARALASSGGGLAADGARRPLVVVKLGRDGALAVGADRTEWHVPAYPIEPVDATGAGDAFDAAFLAAWLGGGSVDEAWRWRWWPARCPPGRRAARPDSRRWPNSRRRARAWTR